MSYTVSELLLRNLRDVFGEMFRAVQIIAVHRAFVHVDIDFETAATGRLEGFLRLYNFGRHIFGHDGLFFWPCKSSAGYRHKQDREKEFLR